MLFPVFILTLSFSHFSKAAICRERKDSAIVVGFDYSQIRNRDSRIHPLGAAGRERALLANFYRNTYGINPKSIHSIDDRTYSIAGATPAERKKAFLNKVKQQSVSARKRNPTANVNLALSGHGIHCIDKEGKRRWCLLLPEVLPKEPVFVKDGDLDVLDLRNDTSSAFVTDKELYDATEMDSLIVDGCHSQSAIKNIEIEHQRMGKTGFFAFSSSPEHILSPGKDVTLGAESGHLVSLLKGLSDAKEDDLCHMDLDNDGEISEREVAFAFQLHGLSRRLGVNSLADLPASASVNSPDPFVGLMNPLVGTVSSNQCLVKIASPTQCSKPRFEEDPYDMCASHKERLKAINSNVQELFKDISKLNFLSPQGKSLAEAKNKEAGGRHIGAIGGGGVVGSQVARSWKELADDPKRSSAVDYILKWSQDNRETSNLYCSQEEPMDCSDNDRFDENIRELQKALLKFAF